MALKVQKSASHYTEAAMDEIEFLRKVASLEWMEAVYLFSQTKLTKLLFVCLQASETPGSGSDHVVRLLDHFKHIGPHGTHVCMVFEPMGANLLSLIKHYDYHGVPINLVRHIARQVPDRATSVSCGFGGNGSDHTPRCFLANPNVRTKHLFLGRFWLDWTSCTLDAALFIRTSSLKMS